MIACPMKRRKKRFESMKNLLEIKGRPYGYGLQFTPKQHQRICAEGDERQMLSPHADVCKQNRCHTSLMAVPKKFRKSRRRVAMINGLYGQEVEATSSTMERAQSVQAYLDVSFPSFVKPMIPSIVTKGFWLSLPKLFCDLHLPQHDATVILEDETQIEYKTKYLADRRGLSGGWRGFSIAHNLVIGDVLVFHMIKFCKMKVYIIRCDHFAEVDAALCLLHFDAHRTQTNFGQMPGFSHRVEKSFKDHFCNKSFPCQ